MSDDRLKTLLSRAGDDGRAEAQLRAWPVVEQAFTTRRDAGDPRRGARLVAALAIAALVAAIAAVGFTAPGSAVADWVREQIAGKPGAKKSAAALTRLPGGGRLLVSSSSGVWVVGADGSRRLLGGYAGATWSPRGLFVGAWRGHELFAVEPGGRIRWSLAREGRIHAADWSPDGFRVAYLSGRQLRVVAGDGTGDRLVRARVRAVTPAWKPEAAHLLAFSPRARVVDVVATDGRALVLRRRLPHRVRALAWSHDGRLLAVAGATRVTVLDGSDGRVRARISAPAGFAVRSIAFAPRAAALAMTLNGPGRARVVSTDLRARNPGPRVLFAGAGGFGELAWSPDARWLAVAWPAADQWIFLRTSRRPGVSAVRGIARQFDPRAARPGSPSLGPWCCG